MHMFSKFEVNRNARTNNIDTLNSANYNSKLPIKTLSRDFLGLYHKKYWRTLTQTCPWPWQPKG